MQGSRLADGFSLSAVCFCVAWGSSAEQFERLSAALSAIRVLERVGGNRDRLIY